MPTNADIWRERGGNVQRIAQGVASGYTPSDVQSDDRFYVLPPGERPVGPGAPKPPLLQNLQLFADYENWSAGQPLPNRYDLNSGVTSLTDNNSVGEETTSPLVDSKSGDYNRSDSQGHSGGPILTQSSHIYASCWVSLNSTTSNNSGQLFLGNINFSTNNGFQLIYSKSKDAFSLVLGDNTGTVHQVVSLIGSPSTNTKYFLEVWFDGDLHIRVNDGSIATASASAEMSTLPADVMGVGYRESDNSIYADGLIDNAAIEVAPPGELRWPSASTWLYNSGAGRSWSEIQNYTP